MRVALQNLWNGQPAPAGVGGWVDLEIGDRAFELSWSLGLLDSPRIPETPAGFADGLWEWDVLELFLGENTGGYLEFEFGPGGHWLALQFSQVRQRSAELRQLNPRSRHHVQDGVWSGEVHLQGLPPEIALGHGLITTVLGSQRLHLTWPALPGAKPDFHQTVAWAALNLSSAGTPSTG